MPTYDYRCAKCGHHLEAFHKISDPPLKLCDKCGNESLVRRPGGGIGLSFLGSGDGFYATMYGNGKQKSENAASECCPCGKNQGSCKSKEQNDST
jgi:putative FmdB family regulatory protein